MKIKFLSSFLLISLFFISCEKNENKKNKKNVSSYNSSKSHNSGANCMQCHKSGGNGEGIFQAAGTVYDSLQTSLYPNCTIRLYSGPNGTGSLRGTIEVDALGNFYTTNSIDFSSGLYPSVSGSQTTHYMGFPISTGQCNSCHGVSTGKIWAK